MFNDNPKTKQPNNCNESRRIFVGKLKNLMFMRVLRCKAARHQKPAFRQVDKRGRSGQSAPMPTVLWTAEQAKAMSVRSVASRRAKAEARKQRRAGFIPTEQQTPAPTTGQPTAGTRVRLARAKEHYLAASERLGDALADKDIPPRDLHALAQAFALLGDSWRRAEGVPDPGSLKPQVERKRPGLSALPEPV